MSYCVYKHTSPNGKVYIGITKRLPSERWEGGKGYKYNKHFYSAILKYGWDNIKHEILIEGLSKEDAELAEIRLIEAYNSADPKYGYNLRLGGSLCGFSQETINKLRESHLGHKHTEEQKRKISAALKGKTASYGMLGHNHSEETKAKISKSNKGKKHPTMVGANNHRAHGVINLDTQECFDTILEASKKYNCNRVGITRCCGGLQETCGGYRWSTQKGGETNG